MNITKLLLVAGAALVGVFAAPSAQARDHDRGHWDHRDRHEFRDHRHFRGNFDRPYAYERRRGVIYRDSYYSQPRTSVTIAVGGHRHHRR